MYRVSREGKRAPDTPRRSQRHRSTTSYYRSARNRLHRLSTRDPWVRFGFNAAAILFILLAVRQMHRGMCDAERPSRLEPMGGDFYHFPHDKTEDGMQDESSHNGILGPLLGVRLRGSGHRTEQSLIDEIENLKGRLAESEELAIKKIGEMKGLEDENDLLTEEVDNLRDQLASRHLGLGTDIKDKGVEEQRMNTAVESKKRIIGTQSAGNSYKEAVSEDGTLAAIEIPFKKLKGVEDVDNLEFQVKERVDRDKETRTREANNNDRLSEGETRKPFTFLKRDEDVLKHAVDKQKEGESVEVDPMITEKVEKDEQLLPASAGGDGGDESEKASGDRSQKSEDVKGVSIEMQLETIDEERRPVVEEVKEPEGVPLEEAGRKDSNRASEKKPEGVPLEEAGKDSNRASEKKPEGVPLEEAGKKDLNRASEEKEPEGVPLEEAGKDSNRASEEKEPEGVPLEEAGRKDSNRDGGGEKNALRGKEGDEPDGNPAAGVADPESESKPEKAFGVAKDVGEALLLKGVVGEPASHPEEVLFKELGDEAKEHKISTADKKAKIDDFDRKAKLKNDQERKESEGVQEKEAVEGGKAEKEEQRQILEQKFVDMLEEASSTDDGDSRTSSSDVKGDHGGDLKDSSPGNEDAQESDHRPVDNEAGAGAPNRDEKQPALVGNFPKDVIKQRDEKALKLLKDLLLSAEES